LFIGSFPPPYHGSNVYFQKLINNSEINNRFEVITLNTSDPRHDLDNLGKFDFINIKTALKNLYQFYKICKERKPDLIYINTPQGIAYIREGLFVLISKMCSKTKIIQHLHGSEFLNFYGNTNIFMKYLINKTQKKIDYSIVLGDNLRYIFKKWNKLVNIFPVPNGIQPQINYTKRELNGKLPVLFFFGNLLKFKGIMLALEILNIVKKDYPDIKLNIAGSWGHDWYYKLSQEKVKEEFYGIIKKNNLESHINFLGPVYDEKKSDLLKESDIFIYPTHMDGFPIVLLEAMSAGCPIITTKMVGAISEVIVNGETGYLISDYSAERYADAVKKIIGDSKLFSQMSENARNRFDKMYTLDINIKNIVSVFEEILSRKN
jgi:glycosyltransferase involved in cell wall biosynthesis